MGSACVVPRPRQSPSPAHSHPAGCVVAGRGWQASACPEPAAVSCSFAAFLTSLVLGALALLYLDKCGEQCDVSYDSGPTFVPRFRPFWRGQSKLLFIFAFGLGRCGALRPYFLLGEGSQLPSTCIELSNPKLRFAAF